MEVFSTYLILNLSPPLLLTRFECYLKPSLFIEFLFLVYNNYLIKTSQLLQNYDYNSDQLV